MNHTLLFFNVFFSGECYTYCKVSYILLGILLPPQRYSLHFKHILYVSLHFKYTVYEYRYIGTLYGKCYVLCIIPFGFVFVTSVTVLFWKGGHSVTGFHSKRDTCVIPEEVIIRTFPKVLSGWLTL